MRIDQSHTPCNVIIIIASTALLVSAIASWIFSQGMQDALFQNFSLFYPAITIFSSLTLAASIYKLYFQKQIPQKKPLPKLTSSSEEKTTIPQVAAELTITSSQTTTQATSLPSPSADTTSETIVPTPTPLRPWQEYLQNDLETNPDSHYRVSEFNEMNIIHDQNDHKDFLKVLTQAVLYKDISMIELCDKELHEFYKECEVDPDDIKPLSDQHEVPFTTLFKLAMFLKDDDTMRWLIANKKQYLLLDNTIVKTRLLAFAILDHHLEVAKMMIEAGAKMDDLNEFHQNAEQITSEILPTNTSLQQREDLQNFLSFLETRKNSRETFIRGPKRKVIDSSPKQETLTWQNLVQLKARRENSPYKPNTNGPIINPLYLRYPIPVLIVACDNKDKEVIDLFLKDPMLALTPEQREHFTTLSDTTYEILLGIAKKIDISSAQWLEKRKICTQQLEAPTT